LAVDRDAARARLVAVRAAQCLVAVPTRVGRVIRRIHAKAGV
jgi:hypothetical protein